MNPTPYETIDAIAALLVEAQNAMDRAHGAASEQMHAFHMRVAQDAIQSARNTINNEFYTV